MQQTAHTVTQHIMADKQAECTDTEMQEKKVWNKKH